jgi:hypothetical protein
MAIDVKRLAILIGAPGDYANGTKHLRGVSEDLKNLKKYLNSEQGGAYLNNEIITINDATREGVLNTIRSVRADFVLIYFSGHGNRNPGIGNFISLQDGVLQDIALLADHLPRQLVIVDACRTFMRLGQISGIPGEEPEQWLHADGFSVIREIMNERILLSPAGKIVVHAVPEGYSTGDTDSGGIFTNRLLEMCKTGFAPSDTYQFADIAEVVRCLKHPHNSHNMPHRKPCITYNEGSLQVPFAFCLPQEQRQPVYFENTDYHSPVTVNWNNVALAALVGLGAYAIFGND